MNELLLTLNAGSSSIKFALFATGSLRELMRGQIENIGAGAQIDVTEADATMLHESFAESGPTDHASALAWLLEHIRERRPESVVAIGHRVVHGGIDHVEPTRITDRVIRDLEQLKPLAPLHQPHNLSGIRAAMACFPDAMQVACFDTAFHRKHPWVNDTFGLPRRFYDEGVRRYGFHGISYEYVSNEFARAAPHDAAGRLVIAHLGNGASMCALRQGRSVGSSMGFTALDGLPMGTRCGQLDPGVVLYLMSEKGLSAEEITDLLYRESGLKGLSGLSNDIRELESSNDIRPLQALEYFVYRVRRELGAMTAVLNGLDALVFCGGIGENAWRIREQICEGFEWLGMELDTERNRASRPRISGDLSRVKIFIVPTDEELMIARHMMRLLN